MRKICELTAYVEGADYPTAMAVAERVAKERGIDDPTEIRLTSTTKFTPHRPQENDALIMWDVTILYADPADGGNSLFMMPPPTAEATAEGDEAETHEKNPGHYL